MTQVTMEQIKSQVFALTEAVGDYYAGRCHFAHINNVRNELLSLIRQYGEPQPITLTGQQIKNALGFVAPDGDADQLECEVCIQWCPARTSEENEPMPAGYYAWVSDYPEEGCIPLDVDLSAPPKE